MSEEIKNKVYVGKCSTLSKKPYVRKEHMVKHEYMTPDGKKIDRICAFYDKCTMRYNDKLSKYEPFLKGKDGKHDPINGELIYHVYMYTKSTDINDKATIVERRVIEKKQVIEGETQFIDDRDYYKPAYDKYLDFKKKGCKDIKSVQFEEKLDKLKDQKEKNEQENEVLRKQVAELQKKTKLQDLVQKPKSIIKEKDNSNDTSDNISKHRKGRKN